MVDPPSPLVGDVNHGQSFSLRNDYCIAHLHENNTTNIFHEIGKLTIRASEIASTHAIPPKEMGSLWQFSNVNVMFFYSSNYYTTTTYSLRLQQNIEKYLQTRGKIFLVQIPQILKSV